MNRLLSLIKHDIKFQFRHGFYLVYSIVTVIYIVILKLLNNQISSLLTPVIIFIDPTFIGFFFIGAILFFEKEQRVADAIFVTPVSLSEYVISKAISLTLLSLAVVFLIIVVVKGLFVNWIYIILGVTLTSSLFIFAGIILSWYFKTITTYLIAGGFLLSPFAAPIIQYFGLHSSGAYLLLPTTASLKLISTGILGGLSLGDSIYSVTYLLILNIGLFKLLLIKGEKS